jgi:hypothetical protein
MWTERTFSRVNLQAEISPGAFALTDPVIHNKSIVLGSGPVEITTPGEQWAFAVTFPFRMNAFHVSENTGSLLIRVEASIESGRIGIGYITRDLKSYITPEVERVRGDGRAIFDLIIEPGADSGCLVVRNTAEGGTRSRVIVHSIRTFRADTLQCPDSRWQWQGLSDYQAAFLQQYPCPQVFAVISWGCAATGWIAAVLNRHPDIYCVHAGNQFWHVLGGCERLDGVSYIRIIGSQGHAHVAAGDVHGVGRNCVPELRRSFGELFNAAVVVRAPIQRLHSQLALFEKFENHKLWDLDYIDGVISRTGASLMVDNYRSRFFVHAANMLNAILEERDVGRIYRSEDLTTKIEVLGDFVEEITRGKVSPTGEWLQSAIGAAKINVHATKGHQAQFSDWQRDVIRQVVDPRSWEIYEALGYQRPEFASG